MHPGTRATLVEGDVARHLVRLAAPMAWGVFVMMAFNLTDTWFVSRLGPRELAAMSFTFPVVMFVVSLGIGLMAGCCSVLARAVGEGDEARVRRLTTDALLLSLAVSIVLGSVGLATIRPLFRLLGADDSLLPLITEYMTPWYTGVALILVPMTAMGAIRAVGDSAFQSRVMTLAALVNLVVDPLLIFGLGGLPRLELAGAATATMLARSVSMWLAFRALYRDRAMLAGAAPVPALWRSWRAIAHVGLPAAGTNVIVPMATGVVVSMLAQFGATAVAGFGVASRVEGLSLVVFLAVSSIIGPFVGQNLGAGRRDRIREAQRLCALFCVLWGLGLAAVLGLAADALVGIFTRDPAVADVGASYLLLVPWSYGAAGLVMVTNAAFNGLGLPLPAVALSLARMVAIYLPAAWIGARLAGIDGIFGAFAMSNALTGLGAFLWFRRAVPASGMTVRLPHGRPAVAAPPGGRS